MKYDVSWAPGALTALKKKVGSFARIGEEVGMSGYAISRNASGQVKMLPDTWDKLYEAFPHDIPAPPWSIFGGAGDNHQGSLANWAGTTNVPFIETDARFDFMSENSVCFNWIAVPFENLGKKPFALPVPDRTMEPHLHQDDIAIVSRSARLKKGGLCFAAWPGAHGDRLIRRYFNYSEVVVLRADKEGVQEIELLVSRSKDYRDQKAYFWEPIGGTADLDPSENTSDVEQVRLFRVVRTIREE